MRILLLLCFLPVFCLAAPHAKDESDLKRMKQLKSYLKKEKVQFEKRKSRRKAILEQLDTINSEQNQVRGELSQIEMNHIELAMALDNLQLQFEKEKRIERVERERLELLLKVFYRLKRDGFLRFILTGGNIGDISNRVRILYRTLKSNSQLTKTIAERTKRLKESETDIRQAKEEAQHLLKKLNGQQIVLERLLSKKRSLVKKINKQQKHFRAKQREYKRVAKRLSAIFDNLESMQQKPAKVAKRKDLLFPVDLGKIVKHFGRSVHKRFKTVTYHKGLEIEAEHQSPVHAVLAGNVEYEGWVKGLGNVLIIHHGEGLYSLSAHLFKALTSKGDVVKKGDTVALVGDTGTNDKPSLYFELRQNGKAVNPIPYFSPKKIKSLL